ncbi:MAG: enoyl-ACP reductase [Gammaproteobacteria bacterium]|jgi:enoyl-[acyl-carrier protein] reductase I|nr:enoyl-ACP reductase [Gammaproteobacteria bacterium]
MILTDQTILILGYASKRSIAYGIAQQANAHGAKLIICCANDKLTERAESDFNDFKHVSLYTLNVEKEDDIQKTLHKIHQTHPNIQGIVHAIAYADRTALQGDITDHISAEIFSQAQHISVYSLIGISKHAPLLMPNGGSILTLTYIGSQRAMTGYNVMGVAKASLESAVRYLALNMGKHNIRVNAISAGPIRTLAASAIGNFQEMLKANQACCPLPGNVSLDEIGDSAVFFLSHLSRGVTGDVLYVDHGFHACAPSF